MAEEEVVQTELPTAEGGAPAAPSEPEIEAAPTDDPVIEAAPEETPAETPEETPAEEAEAEEEAEPESAADRIIASLKKNLSPEDQAALSERLAKEFPDPKAAEAEAQRAEQAALTQQQQLDAQQEQAYEEQALWAVATLGNHLEQSTRADFVRDAQGNVQYDNDGNPLIQQPRYDAKIIGTSIEQYADARGIVLARDRVTQAADAIIDAVHAYGEPITVDEVHALMQEAGGENSTPRSVTAAWIKKLTDRVEAKTRQDVAQEFADENSQWRKAELAAVRAEAIGDLRIEPTGASEKRGAGNTKTYKDMADEERGALSSEDIDKMTQRFLRAV